jgi:hypothetical protein
MYVYVYACMYMLYICQWVDGKKEDSGVLYSHIVKVSIGKYMHAYIHTYIHTYTDGVKDN